MSGSNDEPLVTRVPIDFTLCRLRNTLARLAPRLPEADAATQERYLDEAIALSRLDPTWSEWWHYATELLPAHQATGAETAATANASPVDGGGEARRPTE